MTHLVKVKSEAHKLKNKVMEVDKVVQDSGKDVREDMEEGGGEGLRGYVSIQMSVNPWPFMLQ